MATWKSYTIKSIINKIENRELLLPVIQRELVWSEDKIIALFQTLCLEDSFGGIMTVRDIKSEERMPLFRVRPFVRDYISGNVYNSAEEEFRSRDLEYVIDGQQRLSSIYMGFRGTYNRRTLYFNLVGNCAEDEFWFMFSESRDSLPKNILDESTGDSHTTRWISVPELFEKIQGVSDARKLTRMLLAGDTALTDDERDRFEDNVSRMISVSFSLECVGVCEVTMDVTRPERENRLRIVRLFQKLNQGGTVLSGIELMRSMLKALNADNENFLSKVRDDYADLGLDQDGIVRYVFLLQDQVKKDISDIVESDSDFITANESRIYASLDALRCFLEKENLIDYVKLWHPSSVPFYLLAYYLYHQNQYNNEQLRELFKGDLNSENRQLIRRWMFLTLLNKVFQRGRGWDPNRTARKLVHQVLSSSKGGEFPYNSIIKLYQERLHWFDVKPVNDESRLNQYERSFVLYKMYGKAMLARNNDVDHVIARNLLEKKCVPAEKINTLSNFEPLFFRENRSKQDAELGEWLDANYGNDEPEKARFAKLHYLPADRSLWSSDRFDEFLTARRELIVEKLLSEM